jgi:hypothetical protein
MSQNVKFVTFKAAAKKNQSAREFQLFFSLRVLDAARERLLLQNLKHNLCYFELIVFSAQ